MEERLQRGRLLAARDEFMQKLAGEAKGRLTASAGSNAGAYSGLLKGLIKQGIARLAGEPAVEVRCRPQDLALVQKLAPQAAAEVIADAKAAGEERSVTVTVAASPALATSAGGVALAAKGGTIRCDNTLEARLGLALGDLTPVVRDLLFPSARSEVRTKPAVVPNPHSTLHHHKAAPEPAAAAPGKAAAPGAKDPFGF
jgi:vacuolar-type H+-ATPase subunit E/Vma4